MPSTILGIRIPDSVIAREATQLLRDTASDILFQHSMRVYLWGALSAQRKGIVFDPELLYAGAMFHDFGLTEDFHGSSLRFEVDGANAARDFLKRHGIPEGDIQKVWTAIAVHTTPGVPEFLHAEAALLHLAAGMDVAGRSYDQFTEEEHEAVVAAHPRGEGFKQRIIDAFHEGLKDRPATTFGTFNDDFIAFREPGFQRVNICSIILSSPWAH
ncbi:HD domain-containing protein [Dyella sp. GSA-30]|uniref:HD domain-containing protein n=1 Tax=Dyella sp. GSA-30 TaxID=2994496 RepID=UPI0024928136|nr:HD domain-containing protein [Dyella sp. GSA-30]BDU21490.1 phosphohydrolase [Dyella sp. GSA-30]